MINIVITITWQRVSSTAILTLLFSIIVSRHCGSLTHPRRSHYHPASTSSAIMNEIISIIIMNHHHYRQHCQSLSVVINHPSVIGLLQPKQYEMKWK